MVRSSKPIDAMDFLLEDLGDALIPCNTIYVCTGDPNCRSVDPALYYSLHPVQNSRPNQKLDLPYEPGQGKKYLLRFS